jgi:hypothetical protein
MKSLYTLFATFIFCAFFIGSADAQPTLKTWINATNNDNWHDPDNWSPNGVPNQTGLGTDDVLIPANSIINILPGAPSALSNNLTVEEGVVLTKFSSLALVMTNGNFAPGSELNLLNGSINGGQGLIINGAFNCIGPLPKTVVGTINVTGTMQIQSPSDPLSIGGDLRIFPSGILTVEEGTINTLNFGKLINEGTLQKTAGTGIFNMGCIFENNGGTIDLISGSMDFTNTSTFTNGNYNVNGSGFLATGANNTIFINGTLNGQLDGPFIIDSNSFRVSDGVDGVDTILDFSGPSGLVWQGGALISVAAPNSTLVNLGLITVTSLGNSQTQLSGGVILRNEGEMFFEETVTNFGINQASILNNTDVGEMTIADGVFISGATFTNTGLVQKVAGTGEATINNFDNNALGILNIASGTILHNVEFSGNGLITGSGSILTSLNAEIESTIAPGNNGSGTLTYLNAGSYNSTPDCIYQLDINGITPDSEHDVLAISTTVSSAKIYGTFDIQLNYAPQLNDEFVVITAVNITECNLPDQVSANFNGMTYTFDVLCNSDNVTLSLVNISLGVEENSLINVSLYPNPTTGRLILDLGNTQSEVNVSISNSLGQVITNERFVNTNAIDLTIDGSLGMYFVTLNAPNKNQNTIKILKQ